MLDCLSAPLARNARNNILCYQKLMTSKLKDTKVAKLRLDFDSLIKYKFHT